MEASFPAVRIVVAGAISALAVFAGCGQAEAPSPANSASPSPAPVVDCRRGGTGEPQEEARAQGIAAGPLLFAYARELAGQHWIVRPQAEMLRELIDDADTSERVRRRARRTLRAMPRDGYGIAQILIFAEPDATVTVALPDHERDRAALVYTLDAANRERPGAAGVLTISDGDPAVTFKACADAPTHWNGGLLVSGRPRCLPLDVWVEARREPLRPRLPIGTGEQCSRRVAPRDLLSRAPYMGVSCPTPNSIACDRVGLAVALESRAERVTATIAGQRLVLRPTGRPRKSRTYWEGFLQPAGLLDGPLKVTPDRGRYRWVGRNPVEAPVRITVVRADGTTESTNLRQRLAAGWG